MDAICVSADVLNTTLPLRRVQSVRLQVIELDVARAFRGLLKEMAALAQRVADSVDVRSFARGWLLWLLPCFSHFGRLVNLPMLFLRTSYGAWFASSDARRLSPWAVSSQYATGLRAHSARPPPTQPLSTLAGAARIDKKQNAASGFARPHHFANCCPTPGEVP